MFINIVTWGTNGPKKYGRSSSKIIKSPVSRSIAYHPIQKILSEVICLVVFRQRSEKYELVKVSWDDEIPTNLGKS